MHRTSISVDLNKTVSWRRSMDRARDADPPLPTVTVVAPPSTHTHSLHLPILSIQSARLATNLATQPFHSLIGDLVFTVSHHCSCLLSYQALILLSVPLLPFLFLRLSFPSHIMPLLADIVDNRLRPHPSPPLLPVTLSRSLNALSPHLKVLHVSV